MKEEDYHNILRKYYNSDKNVDGLSYSDEISAMKEAAKMQSIENLRDELVKFLIYWCGTDPVDKERCERVIDKYLMFHKI